MNNIVFTGGSLQDQIIAKYGPIIEGATDSLIEWGPDFFERLITYYVTLNAVYLLLLVLMFLFSLWLFNLCYKKIQKLVKEDGEYQPAYAALLIFVPVFAFPLSTGPHYIQQLIEVLLVPEMYIYTQLFGG